jgi:hypothetical protein
MGNLKVILLGLTMTLSSHAQADPAWWTNRAVVVTNQTVADYGVVNIGQLKHVAHQAYLEFDDKLPGGADTNIANLVSGFSNTNNYALANQGQLKTVATNFYDQLVRIGYFTNYPWTSGTSDDVDFGVVNVGQVKTVFNFTLPSESGGEDFDSDGMPDYWEIYSFGDVDESAGGDFDGDGLNNGDEFTLGTNPNLADTDNDGVDDGDEITQSLDPLTPDNPQVQFIVFNQVY